MISQRSLLVQPFSGRYRRSPQISVGVDDGIKNFCGGAGAQRSQNKLQNDTVRRPYNLNKEC